MDLRETAWAVSLENHRKGGRTMDGFHEPTAKKASPKAAAEAVMMHVTHAGNAALSLLSGLLAAALILYSGFVLYDTFYTQASAARTPSPGTGRG